MRWLLLLVFLLPLASAQSLTGTTGATIDAGGALEGMEGVAIRPVEVTLSVSGFVCTTDTTVVVPLRLDVEGNIEATLEPDRLEFTVPAGVTLATTTTATRTAVLVVRGNETATATVSTGAPTIGCVSAQRGGDSLGVAAIPISWATAQTEPAAPEQIMPIPAWLAVFGLLGVALRIRDNGPKYR